MQPAFRPLIPIPNFLASYILGALTSEDSSLVTPATMLRAVTTACKSLSEAVGKSINATFDWEEECECVLQFLLAASDAATSGFGIEINQVSDIDMSDDLSA